MVLREQRSHEEKMVETIGMQLDQSVKRVAAWTAKHNQNLLETVSEEMRNMTDTLENMLPGEVVIRYDRRGGTPVAAECMEVPHVA